MKKTLIIAYIVIVATLCCAFGLIGCDTANGNQGEAPTISVTSVTLDKSAITLEVGGSELLTATVKPDNATNKNVVWTSSAPSVATVDGSGRVAAVAIGTAVITARAGTKSATCEVIVEKVNIAVTSVTLDKSAITLEVGGSELLTATVKPDNATNKNVVWTSSAPSVAGVDKYGIVIAVSEGTATVTASVGGKSAVCQVTVNKQNAGTPAVAVTGITLDKSAITLEVGGSELLTATVKPDNATNKNVVWTSSAPSVATVDGSGKVTAVAIGTAVITARAGTKSATCEVTVEKVNIAVTSVTLDKSAIMLEVGGSELLTAMVKPDNATNKNVVWTSSAPSVVTVDGSGKVTAVSSGTATVTARAGGKYAACEVTVRYTGTSGLDYSLTTDKTAYKCVGLGTATDSDIVIADEYNDLPVTEIAESAFDGSEIKSVTIGKNIEVIGKSAFANCAKLTTVYWNAVKCRKAGTCDSSIRSIFPYCYKLTEVIIADDVTYLPDYAFYCLAINSIIIPDSVTEIDEDVFTGCGSLNTVTLGKGVNKIGQYAFKNCSALTDVYYTGDLTGWCSIDFGSMEANPLNSADNLYINNRIVTDVVIPAGINVIKTYTFVNYKKLKSLTLPDSVKTIGQSAFRGCNGLESVALPNSLSTVESHAFAYCGLNEITVGEGVTSIGEGAFRGCTKLGVVKWNAVNCYISTSSLFPAFDSCTNVKHVILGDKVTKLSTDFLSGSKITLFKDLKGLERISVGANNTVFSAKSGILYNKAGTEMLYVPQGITGEIEIPDSMTQIGASMFSGCAKITKVTIPSSIVSIGSRAFDNCTVLSGIDYLGDLTGWCAIDFDCSPLASADNLYINNTLVTEVVIPDGVTELNNGPFSGSTAITSIVIPDSVTFIEENALGGCSALESLTVPFVGTAEKIFGVKYNDFGSIFGYEENAYRENCNVPSSLKNVVITGGTSIASYAFEDCYYIENVTLPDSLTSVNSGAFNNCRGLKGVYCGSISSWCGITFADSSANPLHRAKKLYVNGQLVTDLVIPDGVTAIGKYAFYNCTAIVNITISDTVTSIGNSAFAYCSSLVGITMSAGLKTIGESAFAGCTNLTAVNLPVGVTSIGYKALESCEAIDYDGTMEQWKAIDKDSIWTTSSTVTVTCSDGKLDKYDIKKS